MAHANPDESPPPSGRDELDRATEAAALADRREALAVARRERRPVFLPLVLAGSLFLVGGYLAVHIGYVSNAFKPALNQTDPGLARTTPALGPRVPPMARRVVLVIVDGLRLRDSYGLTFLDSVRRAGVDAVATSHYPSFSRPNHVTIVTGVPPVASGVRTNDYNVAVNLDSLMDRARAAGMKVGFASDESDGLLTMFSREVAGADANAPKRRGAGNESPRYASPFHDGVRATWPGGFERAIRRMLAQDDSLLVLVPSAVDRAGHEHGGDSPEYRAAVERVDALLHRTLAQLDLERDALIITADHGHTDQGGHGGYEPDVMEVPLIMAGSGVRQGAAVVGAELSDVAPTAAVLLGLSAPRHALGRALTEGLVMEQRERDLISDAEVHRIADNRAAVSAWLDTGHDAVNAARIWRLPLVLVLTSLGLGLLLLARRKRALQIDVRVLLIALPAFPASYYALLAVFGQQFSPSFIPDRGELIFQLFRFGLVATAVHIVSSWFAFRGRKVLAERLATANGLFACGLLISLVAVGLAWAIWPQPYIEVPSPSLIVLIPATYVACACYGLAVIGTLGLEIIVFFARAVDPRL